MSRRHFMRHLAGAAAFTLPAFAFARTLRANAKTLSKNHKSAILLVAGWWAAVDRYVGHEAGGADGGAVQADFDDGRFSDLRDDAEAGEAEEAPVDRAVDEHARGGSRARPVLHAHGVRAEPERRASELRVGGCARDGEGS